MNKVILVGRLVRDNEVKYSSGENSNAVLRNSIALNRRFKNAEGRYDADFPNIVAFGKTAEFINQYFNKGDMIGIVGRLQTGNYTNKDGVKVYTTDVIVEEVEFVGSKNNNGGTNQVSSNTTNTTMNNDFMNVPDDMDDDVPWGND